MLSFAVAGSSASSPVPAACDAPSTLRRLIVRAAAVIALAIGAWLLCSMLATPHASADTGAVAHTKAPAKAKSSPAKNEPVTSLLNVLTKVLTDTTAGLTHPGRNTATVHRTPAAHHTGHAASGATSHGSATAAATHTGATHTRSTSAGPTSTGTKTTGSIHAGSTTTPAREVDPLTALLQQLSPVIAPVTTVVDQAVQTVTDVADQLLQPLLGPMATVPTVPAVSEIPTTVLSSTFGEQPAIMTSSPTAGTHAAVAAAAAAAKAHAATLLTGPSRNALGPAGNRPTRPRTCFAVATRSRG